MLESLTISPSLSEGTCSTVECPRSESICQTEAGSLLPGVGTLKSQFLRSVVAALAFLVFAATASAQGLTTLRDLEARLLEQRLDEHSEADRRARTAESEYRSLRERLSGILGDSTISLKELRTLEADTSLARERSYLRDREATALRREIYSHLERIQEMDRELAGLGPRIVGTWTINFGGDFGSGTVAFRMNGQQVDGTYILSNGATGLIRGELLGRNAILTRYGPGGNKQMRVHGQLSSDGQTMSGDWVATELAGGGQAVGTWSAKRGPQPPQ